MNNKKIKVSKEQFALVLYNWLSKDLTEKAIKEFAKDLEFRIKNKEEFNGILEELSILGMWLIVYTCEGVLKDEDKRNECLDIFHRFVYERNVEGAEEDFNKWWVFMGTKYIEYNKAMETDHPSTPLWVVAKLVNKNLFGEIKKDPILQMKIMAHISLNIKHLGELIKKYDIE